MKEIKEIKIFLSCPVDLVNKKDIVSFVREIFDDSNLFYKSLGFRFELDHWTKNVYLGEGNPRVQDRLNDRLVSACDIFIGVFWTRFGTPPGIRTDGLNYNSGTEEEFYIAKKLEKELWFFFCDSLIRPSDIDPDQLKKVKEFKKRLQDERIEYRNFSEQEEFRKLILSSISNWLDERYKLPKEKTAVYNELPQKKDFKKFNRGF